MLAGNARTLDINGKKWKLTVQKQTTACADDMWSLASKFCGLKMWVPDLLVCEQVDGEENVPGCIRYCAGISSHNTQESPVNRVIWVKEELLSWDPLAREYSYTILDSNLGFEDYKATFSMSDPQHDGCALVTWNVEVSPVLGYDEKEFLQFISRILERNITSLEKASHSLSLKEHCEVLLSSN